MMNVFFRMFTLILAVIINDEFLYAIFGSGPTTFVAVMVTAVVLGHYWDRIYNFLFNTKGDVLSGWKNHPRSNNNDS